jgi:hypothetical protein
LCRAKKEADGSIKNAVKMVTGDDREMVRNLSEGLERDGQKLHRPLNAHLLIPCPRLYQSVTKYPGREDHSSLSTTADLPLVT